MTIYKVTKDGDKVAMTSEEETAHTQAMKSADTEGLIHFNTTERNSFLLRSDWTQTLDAPLSDSVKAAWVTYRQALRDLPDHSNWPNLESGDWPTKP